MGQWVSLSFDIKTNLKVGKTAARGAVTEEKELHNTRWVSQVFGSN
jgi:hypothetical protein